MFIAALILAQVVGSAPAPPKSDAAPNSGLDARRIKLNRSVSFQQDRVPILPTPTPVPLPKAGAPVPAVAVEAKPDHAAIWLQRSRDALRAHETAVSAYAAAKAAVGDCVTIGRAGLAHSTCMAARTSTLTPYEVNVTMTREALAAVTAACSADANCQPGWVADRVR